jgi:hypothetical protein
MLSKIDGSVGDCPKILIDHAKSECCGTQLQIMDVSGANV